MSIKCMNWAWSLSLKPTTKLVLMSLSDTADDFGECFPSIKYIANRCCISTRHTRREIRKLVELHLITAETRYRKDGSHTSNLYVLAVPKIGEDNLSPHPTPIDRRSQERVTPKPEGDDEQTLPLTTIEPSNKPTTTTTESSLQHWPTKLSAEEREAIQKLVVGIPDEVAQELLDELAGQLNTVKKPVAYFYSLVKKHKDDSFTASSSTQIKASRAAKAEHDLAVQHAHRLHKQRLKNYAINVDGDTK